MKDYRYVIYPEKHRKMQCLVMLGMMKRKDGNSGMSEQEIVKQIKARQSNTVKELYDEYRKGLSDESNKSLEKYKSYKDVKSKDYAFAYGVH